MVRENSLRREKNVSREIRLANQRNRVSPRQREDLQRKTSPQKVNRPRKENLPARTVKTAVPKKEARPRTHPLLALVLITGIICTGLYLRGLRAQVTEAEMRRDALQQEVETLTRANESLAADIAEGVTDEKIAQIARDELGMVAPGEYVFYSN